MRRAGVPRFESPDQVEAVLAGLAPVTLGHYRALTGAIGASSATPPADHLARHPLPAVDLPDPGEFEPAADALLPAAHERQGRTNLVRLLSELDEPAPPGLAREREAICSAARLVRALFDGFAPRIEADGGLLLAGTAALSDEWRRYYPFIVASGTKSLLVGVGTRGCPHLVPPFVPFLVAATLRRRSVDPVGDVLDVVRRPESKARYGTTFTDRPGGIEPPVFPPGGEPPEAIREQLRTCIGIPYVQAVCDSGFAILRAHLEGRAAGEDHHRRFVDRWLP